MRHEVVKDGEPTVGLLALPHIDPMRGRRRIDVAYGMTVGEMVAVALPCVKDKGRVRVSIGEHVIDPKVWHRVRPHHGATVMVRAMPGDDALRNVLSVAVLVAAVALGQFYAPAIAGSLLPASFTGYGAAVATAGTISMVGSLATAGFAIAGSLLLNALVPVRGLGDQDKGTDIYAITGLKNSANPGGIIPSILGTHRYAPVYAAPPFTEIIDDDQFVTAAFNFGHGPLVLRNHRIGDTPIDQYRDVEIQIRYGYGDDEPLTLYPRQMVEVPLSFHLDGDGANSFAYQYTATNASAVGVDIAFVQGLVKFDKKGKQTPYSVGFNILQRRIDVPSFELVAHITITSDQRKIIRRNYSWSLPTRGQYEILVQRTTSAADDTSIMDRSDWSVIRSYRPEYPINFPAPLCVVAVRIRASGQLNGTLDNYNADASLICRDWDTGSGTWIERETSNPASLFRHVLQGPANAYPKTDDQIDIAGLQEWHEYCTAKGLKYDRVHDYAATRLDVLADIAAAGRATPHDDGVKWGVVVDRPKTTYVSAISPRNSWDFQGTTPQVLFPDGHRVQFIDSTNGYQQAERVIPFPGVNPDAVAVTEDMAHPGKTDPDEIWRETRRRQYELIHRPHTYSVSQDIESLVLGRMDLALLNHDVLDRDHVAARIRAVDGQRVTLDTPVTMVAGRNYALSIRQGDGTSIRRSALTAVGEASSMQMIGDLTGTEVGNLALFGTSIKGPALDVIVKSIERGENLTAKLTLVDASPQIDALVDAEVPPPWDGAVGEIIDVSGLVPAAPSVTVTDAFLTFTAAVVAGAGAVAVPVSYIVSYRLHGGGAFTSITIPAVQGAVNIVGFSVGDTIDVKAVAVSSYGLPSADSPIVQATMHEAVATTPSADDNTNKADTTLIKADFF